MIGSPNGVNEARLLFLGQYVPHRADVAVVARPLARQAMRDPAAFWDKGSQRVAPQSTRPHSHEGLQGLADDLQWNDERNPLPDLGKGQCR